MCRRSGRSRAACRRSACPISGSRTLGELAAGGIGVMLIAFAEGLGAAKAYAGHDDRPVDANRELVALGGSNLASGLSSGMVVSGSLSKTAVNASAGARTQVSTILAAGLTVVALLFLTGLFEDLPAGDARRRRHRGGHRARRRARARRPLQHLHEAPRSPVRVGRTPGLARRRRRSAGRDRLRDAAGPVHRHRRLAAAAHLPSVATVRRGARPHARSRRRLPRHRPSSRRASHRRHRRRAGSRAACTSPTPRTSAPASSRSAAATACTP